MAAVWPDDVAKATARGKSSAVTRLGSRECSVGFSKARAAPSTKTITTRARQRVLEELEVARRLEMVLEEIAGIVLVLSRGKAPRV